MFWIFLLVAATVTVSLYFKYMAPKKIRMIQWKEGTRWVRAFPNPGIKVAAGWRWSRFRGLTRN